MATAADVIAALKKQASPAQAKVAQWFFKTGKGEYGEHEQFIGVKVPNQRLVAKSFKDLPLNETVRLLRSEVHEHRLTALFILVSQFQKGDEATKRKIAMTYLKERKQVNNWDLVDSSAPHILGASLRNRPRAVLYRLAKSKNIWERRIAILATQDFIRHGEYKDTLAIAALLVNDSHDLMHKAVGWMLREVGNRDRAAEERFLKRYYKKMPRTMLRYAVEKFSKKARKYYLTGH